MKAGRVVAAVIVLLGAMAASAGDLSEVRIEPPPGKIYLDDVVHVMILRGNRAGYSSEMKIESSGFRVERRDWGNEFSLTPTAEGIASLGPIYFLDQRNRTLESIPRVYFRVEPPADDPTGSADDAIRELRRRQRTPVTIRARSNWIRTYAGLPVTISWDAIYAPEPTGFTMRLDDPPKIENLTIVKSDLPEVDTSQGELGVSTDRRELGRWTVIASAPGRYSLDPGWARSATKPGRGESLPFRRKVPEILVEALEPPEGVGPDTPIGDFTLVCPSYAVRGGTGAVLVAIDVKGSGIIRNGFKIAGARTRPIIFYLETPARPDLSSPSEAYSARARMSFLSTGTSAWELQVPAFSYSYWSPTTRSMQVAHCKATTLAMQGTPKAPIVPADKRAGRSDIVLTFAELVAIAFAVAVTIAVYRAARA